MHAVPEPDVTVRRNIVHGNSLSLEWPRLRPRRMAEEMYAECLPRFAESAALLHAFESFIAVGHYPRLPRPPLASAISHFSSPCYSGSPHRPIT